MIIDLTVHPFAGYDIQLLCRLSCQLSCPMIEIIFSLIDDHSYAQVLVQQKSLSGVRKGETRHCKHSVNRNRGQLLCVHCFAALQQPGDRIILQIHSMALITVDVALQSTRSIRHLNDLHHQLTLSKVL